jgi:hypothetical protein
MRSNRVPVCLSPLRPGSCSGYLGTVPPTGLPCWAKQDRYINGDCYLLAQAVATITGWRPVTVDMTGNNGHAMVELPDGRLLDAAGLHDRDDPAEPIKVYDRLEWGHRGAYWWPIREWCLPDILADAHELLARLEDAP